MAKVKNSKKLRKEKKIFKKKKKSLLKQIKPEAILNSEFNHQLKINSQFDIKATNTVTDKYIEITNTNTTDTIKCKNTPVKKEKLFKWSEVYKQVCNLAISYFRK